MKQEPARLAGLIIFCDSTSRAGAAERLAAMVVHASKETFPDERVAGSLSQDRKEPASRLGVVLAGSTAKAASETEALRETQRLTLRTAIRKDAGDGQQAARYLPARELSDSGLALKKTFLVHAHRSADRIDAARVAGDAVSDRERALLPGATSTSLDGATLTDGDAKRAALVQPVARCGREVVAPVGSRLEGRSTAPDEQQDHQAAHGAILTQIVGALLLHSCSGAQ